MAIIKKSTNSDREGVEKKEPSYIVGGTVNWYSHCGEQFLKKLKTELPNDPTIPFLGIYPKETII